MLCHVYESTYYSSLLHAGIQLNPADVILGDELASGYVPPIFAGKLGVGLPIGWRVVHEILDGGLSKRWVTVAGRGGTIAKVVSKALAMR